MLFGFRLELYFGEIAENDENYCSSTISYTGYDLNNNHNAYSNNNNLLWPKEQQFGQQRQRRQQNAQQQQKQNEPLLSRPEVFGRGWDEEDEEKDRDPYLDLGRENPENDEAPQPDGLLTNLSVDYADATTARDFYEANKHEVYKNFSSPKGLALIINNFDFRFHSQRHGTAVDVKNLTNLLSQLGYRVLPPCQDLTAAKIRDQARRFALSREHEHMHSCVVVVLSHGEYDSIVGVDGVLLSNFEFFSIFNARNAPLLAGKPRIFIMQACRGALHDSGVERLLAADEPDAGLLRWRTPLRRKSSQNFQNDNQLPRKANSNDRDAPKHSNGGIFARIGLRLGWSAPRDVPREESATLAATMSATVVEKPSMGQSLRQFFPEPLRPQDLSPQVMPPASGGSPSRIVHEPTDSDMLIAYATTPNYVSWRNSERGTWFVQAICEVFSRHAKHEDILTMLTRVNHYVASKFNSSCGGNKQIPECTNRLRRKFYFFPGWRYEDPTDGTAVDY